MVKRKMILKYWIIEVDGFLKFKIRNKIYPLITNSYKKGIENVKIRSYNKFIEGSNLRKAYIHRIKKLHNNKDNVN